MLGPEIAMPKELRLPNPLAKAFAMALLDLSLDDWLFVWGLSPRADLTVAKRQASLWEAERPVEHSTLMAVWTAAANAAEVVALAAIVKGWERADGVGDLTDLNLWSGLRDWLSKGGGALVGIPAGHLATRQFSDRSLIPAATFPMSEVLPFARYAVNRDAD
jgi:hypothetical protein